MSRSLLLSLLFFLPLTGKSQTLLPLPQHFSKTKGSFSLSAAYNYVDKTGGEAKNIYLDNFARPSSNSKRAFVLLPSNIKLLYIVSLNNTSYILLVSSTTLGEFL